MPSVKDFADNLSTQLEGDAFTEKLKEEAEVAGVANVVATVEVQSMAVAEEVQVATKTNAAVSFQQTVSIPVQNLAEVNPDVIQLLVDALLDLLRSVACVSMIILLEGTLIPLTSIAWLILSQPQASNIIDCRLSYQGTQTTSISASRKLMHVSRQLVSEIISFTYRFDVDLECPSSGCNVNSITTALEDAASTDLNNAIGSGQLLSELQNNTNGTVSIITGEATLESSGCSCDNSTQVGSSGTVTGVSTSNDPLVWYPVWGATDKCSNAPGMPTYMQGSSHYTSTCKY